MSSSSSPPMPSPRRGSLSALLGGGGGSGPSAIPTRLSVQVVAALDGTSPAQAHARRLGVSPRRSSIKGGSLTDGSGERDFGSADAEEAPPLSQDRLAASRAAAEGVGAVSPILGPLNHRPALIRFNSSSSSRNSLGAFASSAAAINRTASGYAAPGPSPAHHNHKVSGDFGSGQSPVVSQSARGPGLGKSFGSPKEIGVRAISAAAGGGGGNAGGHSPAAGGFGVTPSNSPLPAASNGLNNTSVGGAIVDDLTPLESSGWEAGLRGSGNFEVTFRQIHAQNELMLAQKERRRTRILRTGSQANLGVDSGSVGSSEASSPRSPGRKVSDQPSLDGSSLSGSTRPALRRLRSANDALLSSDANGTGSGAILVSPSMTISLTAPSESPSMLSGTGSGSGNVTNLLSMAASAMAGGAAHSPTAIRQAHASARSARAAAAAKFREEREKTYPDEASGAVGPPSSSVTKEDANAAAALSPSLFPVPSASAAAAVPNATLDEQVLSSPVAPAAGAVVQAPLESRDRQTSVESNASTASAPDVAAEAAAAEVEAAVAAEAAADAAEAAADAAAEGADGASAAAIEAAEDAKAEAEHARQVKEAEDELNKPIFGRSATAPSPSHSGSDACDGAGSPGQTELERIAEAAAIASGNILSVSPGSPHSDGGRGSCASSMMAAMLPPSEAALVGMQASLEAEKAAREQSQVARQRAQEDAVAKASAAATPATSAPPTPIPASDASAVTALPSWVATDDASSSAATAAAASASAGSTYVSPSDGEPMVKFYEETSSSVSASSGTVGDAAASSTPPQPSYGSPNQVQGEDTALQGRSPVVQGLPMPSSRSPSTSTGRFGLTLTHNASSPSSAVPSPRASPRSSPRSKIGPGLPLHTRQPSAELAAIAALGIHVPGHSRTRSLSSQQKGLVLSPGRGGTAGASDDKALDAAMAAAIAANVSAAVNAGITPIEAPVAQFSFASPAVNGVTGTAAAVTATGAPSGSSTQYLDPAYGSRSYAAALANAISSGSSSSSSRSSRSASPALSASPGDHTQPSQQHQLAVPAQLHQLTVPFSQQPPQQLAGKRVQFSEQLVDELVYVPRSRSVTPQRGGRHSISSHNGSDSKKRSGKDKDEESAKAESSVSVSAPASGGAVGAAPRRKKSILRMPSSLHSSASMRHVVSAVLSPRGAAAAAMGGGGGAGAPVGVFSSHAPFVSPLSLLRFQVALFHDNLHLLAYCAHVTRKGTVLIKYNSAGRPLSRWFYVQETASDVRLCWAAPKTSRSKPMSEVNPNGLNQAERDEEQRALTSPTTRPMSASVGGKPSSSTSPPAALSLPTTHSTSASSLLPSFSIGRWKFNVDRSRSLLEMQGIHYGPFYSANFCRFLDKADKASGKPWLCFSVQFKDRTIDLVASNEHEVTAWFLGLQAQAPMTVSHMSRGMILWQRLIMKMNWYSLEQIKRVFAKREQQAVQQRQMRQTASTP